MPPATSAPDAAFARFRAAEYFPALDSLRGLAVLLVLFHHTRRPPDDPFYTLQQNGRFGVSLFFVLSGFLICTLLLRERERTGRIALGKFFGRRAVRLFPLYYAILLLHVVLVFGTSIYSARGSAAFSDNFLSYVFYFSNWTAQANEGPFFFSWSLAAEEQFYLCFGVAMLFLSRWTLAFAAGVAIATKFILFQTFGQLDAQSLFFRVLFSYQEPLLLGVLLALAANTRTGFALLQKTLGRPAVLVGAAAFCVAWLALHTMQSANVWDGLLLMLGLTAVTGALVLRGRTEARARGPLAHLGRVSYGVYLMHVLVFSALQRVIPNGWPNLYFLVATAVTTALATASYVYFEQPIIRRCKAALRADTRPPFVVEGVPSLHIAKTPAL